MKEHTRTMSGLSIGLDLGDKWSHFCILQQDGEVYAEGTVRTTQDKLSRFFGKFGPSRVAFEVGTHSPWVAQIVEQAGHEAIAANPRKLRLIYENDRKNDRADAAYLARLARVDKSLLSPILHRSPENRADLEVVRVRDLVVRTRTSLVVHVRSVVKSFGYRLPVCAAKSFPLRMAALIPPELKETLDPVLELIGRLTRQIREYNKRLVRMAKERYPVMERLQQIVGIGTVTSAAYVLVIEDPHRFKRSRTVGAYVGLVPRQDQSGGRDPQLRITKAGDLLLRKYLTGAAHYILGPFGPDTDLKRFGEALLKRGGKGAKKRAAVAVARKLAVLMHHLWITNEEYDSLHNGKRRDLQKTKDRSRARCV